MRLGLLPSWQNDTGPGADPAPSLCSQGRAKGRAQPHQHLTCLLTAPPGIPKLDTQDSPCPLAGAWVWAKNVEVDKEGRSPPEGQAVLLLPLGDEQGRVSAAVALVAGPAAEG